ALARSPPSSSISNTLPWRTLATPATPRERSAPSIALPCGSRMPVFSVTVTRAFISRPYGMSRGSKPGRNVLFTAKLETRKAGTRPTFASFTCKNGCIWTASALHQHGAGAARRLALVHDAEALGDLGIGLHQPAQIAAEPVLVELVVGLDVPEAATVGRNLVRHHDAHDVVFPQAAGFHLEIDQADADAEEKAGEEIVDADRQRHDVVDFLRRGPAEGRDVLLRYHR